MTIEFPITVEGFDVRPAATALCPQSFTGDCGDWVSIRPCADEHDGKTFLGILLGDLAREPVAIYNTETRQVTLDFGSKNPAIYIPDLKQIIMGFESWWSTIKSPEDLRKISDQDIENVWYVRALKELMQKADDQKAN